MASAIALVSAGRDPFSGRPRRAVSDACALAAGLGVFGGQLAVVHAGDPDEPALFEYLGSGAGQITVLPTPGGAGVAAGLAAYIREQGFDLVLTGAQAETGPGSGCLPYAIARQLGIAIVPAALEVSVAGDRVRCLVMGSGSRRRVIEARLPAIALFAPRASALGPFVYGRARQGRIVPGPPIDAAGAAETPRAVRRLARARRLPPVEGATAWQRIRQIVGADSAVGEIVTPDTAEAAAERLLDAIARTGVWSDAIQPSEQRKEQPCRSSA